MTIPPVFFWFLFASACLGWLCLLGMAFCLFMVLWSFRQFEHEEKNKHPDLTHLKKIDSSYRS